MKRSICLALTVFGLGVGSVGCQPAPKNTSDEINLADAYSHAGVYTKAAPHYERAKALREASVGAEHPDIALIESDPFALAAPARVVALADLGRDVSEECLQRLIGNGTSAKEASDETRRRALAVSSATQSAPST